MFRAHPDPFLITFGVQDSGFPSPKCPKPKGAAQRHRYIDGMECCGQKLDTGSGQL